MADEQQLAVLRQGTGVWNSWREQNPDSPVNLSGADLSGANLNTPASQVWFRGAFVRVGPPGANLSGANLSGATLIRANFPWANLKEANLTGANLKEAELFAADLTGAYLLGSDLSGAFLKGANLSEAALFGAKLIGARLVQAHLSGVNFSGVTLQEAQFCESDLSGANFANGDLSGVNLYKACLKEANLYRAYLRKVNLSRADFSGANLSEADLEGTNLMEADLSGANLSEANLLGATLVGTNFKGADLTGCCVYGTSAWNVKLEGAEQKNLIITPRHEPEITVDNLEVAQFIYLLLQNERIRDVIDTIGQKGVLLLGRFTGGRIAVLERLRAELRERRYVPMVFNFDRPATKTFTETVQLLAGMSRFVIADITSPRSTPLELQATVPGCMVPFVPILEKGQKPFAMLEDLWVKHREWVLEPIRYSSVDGLVRGLDAAIVEPALARSAKLMTRKAKKYKIRDIEDISVSAARRRSESEATEDPSHRPT